MIRFQPDTLRDALWRPLAMVAPDAGVYAEIMAPDLRFAILLVLTLLGATIGLARRQRPGPSAGLLTFAWLAFIPWLATTGNGRYFMVVLLLAGPLCIALVHRLPISRNARLTLCITVITAQLVVVIGSDPLRRWALVPWGTPYLDIALTNSERDNPAAWVIISGISYSLVAPQVHPGSRWVNLHFLSGDAAASAEDRLAQQRLAKASSEGLAFKLLLPTEFSYAEPTGLPNKALRDEIHSRLAHHHLSLSGSCEVRASRVMGQSVSGEASPARSALADRTGFWVCPLVYASGERPILRTAPELLKVDPVFDRVEQQCPRLFPPGSSRTVRVQGGYKRSYSGADLQVYVLDSGAVQYKYWRALNPNVVGTREQVMDPVFKMDCHQVRGRSGLPWERKL